MKPSLLVLIPTYNRSDSLKKNLENLVSLVSNDSRISINILVGDNYSEDDTATLLIEYSRRFNWINFYLNESNVGITKNIIRGVSKCEEDYLWILGDDDYVSSDIFNEIVLCILESREMICLWEKRFLDLDAALNFISQKNIYKKLVKPSFSKISLKWRRKIAIKSGFISSFIFKKSLYLDGFSRFDQKISHQNNYFLRACILNAISKSNGVSLFNPGIAVMRQKGSESHFTSDTAAIKTFLFDDLDVTVVIIQEKLLIGISLWLYLYDFFRSRTGLLKTFGVNKYSEVLNNLNLKKYDHRMVKIIFIIYTLKTHKSF
jgi:hypothetical protein